MRRRIVLGFLFAAATLMSSSALADNWEKILNLNGSWKFSIGDHRRWAEPGYDDKDWETIYVPSKWEDEGFHGYDGYAWYRRSFNGDNLSNKDWSYSLFLGYIDDVDEVYFNGHLIGYTGAFPPNYITAYNAKRHYHIPSEFINFNGKNVIAVRVYDSQIEGGIVRGDIGIYVNKKEKELSINLRGLWDFSLAGYTAKANNLPSEDDKWVKISVPAKWEDQGFKNYDGVAWYRKEVYIPQDLAGEELVLILGKIDDFDDVYINGKLIGTSKLTSDYRNNTAYGKLRTYFISPEEFNAGQKNTILILVEDIGGYGGIYEGPVGIIKQTQFTKFLRWR